MFLETVHMKLSDRLRIVLITSRNKVSDKLAFGENSEQVKCFVGSATSNNDVGSGLVAQRRA